MPALYVFRCPSIAASTATSSPRSAWERAVANVGKLRVGRERVVLVAVHGQALLTLTGTGVRQRCVAKWLTTGARLWIAFDSSRSADAQAARVAVVQVVAGVMWLPLITGAVRSALKTIAVSAAHGAQVAGVEAILG
jgi:hypothetical protein